MGERSRQQRQQAMNTAEYKYFWAVTKNLYIQSKDTIPHCSNLFVFRGFRNTFCK